MVQQCVDQRAVLVAGGGVDDHAARLDHHSQVSVFIEDNQGDVLGLGDGGLGRGDGQNHRLPRLGFEPRLGDDLPIHGDAALFHEGRHPAAGQPRLFRQEDVQPPPVGDKGHFSCFHIICLQSFMTAEAVYLIKAPSPRELAASLLAD